MNVDTVVGVATVVHTNKKIVLLFGKPNARSAFKKFFLGQKSRF